MVGYDIIGFGLYTGTNVMAAHEVLQLNGVQLLKLMNRWIISLYAHFKNKEKQFCKSLNYYS